MTPELFKAILAMDSYNRGYDQSISGLGDINSWIGNAKLVAQSDIGDGSSQVAAGFYAAAYDWNGQKVISYRGTDSAADIWAGWAVGVGIPGVDPSIGPGSQAKFAADFYQSVTGKGLFDGPAANVILTGHSLGGGLAGFVGSLTGTSATVFDNMPYGAAAFAVAAARNAFFAGQPINTIFDSNGNPIFSPGYVWPTSNNITARNVTGEVLVGVRALASAAAAILYAPFGPAIAGAGLNKTSYA